MLEFLKEILESNKGEDGVIDISKVMKDAKKEAPKNLIPKETFNEKNEDLKAANELVEQLKKDNKDVEELQTQIDKYKLETEKLNNERAEDKKHYTLKEKLVDAGAKDVDYMIYKLGDVETDSDGNIKDLDNKIKELSSEYESMFETVEVDEPVVDKKGYEVLDNGLEEGQEPNAEQRAKTDFEQALGI